jgi:hypothetical protein
MNRIFALFTLAMIASTTAAYYTALPTPKVETPKPMLGSFVLQVMDEAGAKLSEVHRAAIADQIVAVAEHTFDSREQQEAFVLLVAIESKFNPKAKSTVGAIGLAQVMPKYAQEFATACGLGELETGDLEYPAVNLKVGACQFQRLLETHNGSIPLALAGFNSGMHSPTVKRLAGLAAGNPETDSYIAKFAVLRAKLDVNQLRQGKSR